MQRQQPLEGIPQAARRPLKIFSSDPLQGRTFGNRARIDVANEPLLAGPVGSRVEVIDYDGAQKCFYSPVDLNNPAILMQGGLDPSESDPRFHQQMVYAVAMKTLENFDRALGRILRLEKRDRSFGLRYPRLRLFPHAFHGANAFYSNELNAILFGYFRADPVDPGPNLPGQTVFTCLSHDVVAHEMTHAIVDRLRPLFLEPSNEDVLAFHEGFADLIALFQHFSFQDVLRDQIQRTRTDIRTPTPLVELARQFGFATGSGKALRSALDTPNAKLYQSVVEPHDRGSILVAAVFDGFFKTYQRRIYDLVRIATGGTGTLPSGDLHPDLVNRIAGEASRTAQRVLDMCIRAFDYLPPVDVTFGDFLRAMVTADYELIPDDEWDHRGAMIEAFRLRGIYPAGVTSLAEESLLWETSGGLPPIGEDAVDLLPELFFEAVRSFDGVREVNYRGSSPPKQFQQFVVEEEGEQIELGVSERFATSLHQYALTNLDALGLDPNQRVQVRGFHPVFRVAPNGRLLIEVVVQFAQQDRSRIDELGGIPFRGGATLIASAEGQVRYVIRKPMRAEVPGSLGAARLEKQIAYLNLCDMRSPRSPYLDKGDASRRMLELMNLSALHGG